MAKSSRMSGGRKERIAPPGEDEIAFSRSEGNCTKETGPAAVFWRKNLSQFARVCVRANLSSMPV
jgi:hypothetical protein